MYNVQDSSALVAGHRALLRPRAAGLRVPRTVVLLGLTSLLTDISSEAVAAVLPLYLVYAAGFSPLALGVIDGLYRGAAAITALASGFWADRRKRHKEVATLGYGLSAVTKLGLVAAGGAVAPIAVFVMLDRIGKGIRTAPRDALISLSASPQDARDRVRRPPGDGHHRRHARAADGVRDPARSRRWRSHPCSSSRSASRSPGSA